MIPVTSVRTLSEAYAVLGQRIPGLRVLAGGTDFMVALNARVGLERIGHVLDLWSVAELRGLERRGATLCLGALTTYSELMGSPLVRSLFPALALVSNEVGAWAIQNRGTLGGNVCNASPAGDTLPILLAADARLILGGPRGERTVPATSERLSPCSTTTCSPSCNASARPSTVTPSRRRSRCTREPAVRPTTP